MRVLRGMAVVMGVFVCWWAAVTSAWALDGVAPVPGPVARGFDPPDQPWLSGHRGVDLRASPGDPVRAALDGRVTFAGTLAGRGVIVVDHGGLRTTYLPVTASVPVGARVAAGQVIGTVDGGHGCLGGTCLHWGLKRGEAYLDPLSLLGAADLRLLPGAAVGTAIVRTTAREQAFDSGGDAPGLLLRPVSAQITSRFGMRFHPIFHEWRMHNGVDLSAACRTPIRAAASGRVLTVGYDSSGGHRLVIDHGVVGGRRLTTSYLHASGYQVRPGQKVIRGQVVGSVGSTGWSTGCHLHLSVALDGRQVDPERFL